MYNFRSSRSYNLRKKKPQNVSKLSVYFDGPYHEGYGPGVGGKKMAVVLGPSCIMSEHRGSRQDLKIPGIMKDLHNTFPHKFIAGHLLNETMGGSGLDWINLTPLTHTAHKNHHKKVEEPIKYALIKADQRFRLYNEDYIYGIKYTVEVLPEVMDSSDALLKRVPKGIKCNAKLVKMPRNGGEILDTSNDEKVSFNWSDLTFTLVNLRTHLMDSTSNNYSRRPPRALGVA